MTRASKAASQSWLACLLAAWAMCAGCQPTAPTTSSETHFLRFCPESESCSGQLACMCTVCTQGCEEDADCAELSADAVCVPTETRTPDQACEASAPEGTCEVPCGTSQDCAALGTAYRCDRSYCRALSADCATGEVAGSEVVLLGDNFMPLALVSELERLAQGSGALGAEENYRNHASTLVGPFGGSSDLFSQYAAALAEGTPRLVITDMGGPDALQSCPEPPAADCPALTNAESGAEELLTTMAQDGVEDVLVFFYPTPEDPTLTAKFDLLRPMIGGVCAASAVPCTFLDLRPTFTGNEAEYLLPDGVLPTDAGAVATAAAIFSVMQEHCLAQ